ncbi:RagB/SusD family nutrient uptake outer membrane protein, partial [Pseudoflavonifractor sp. BIOML-A4]|nr:RagB/SusD family nutrient uptake outer membrane protein [Pseudoflavonifractor sp. BIOML-A4]
LYASPLFNRKNDVERWRKAYNEITADLPRINACGYGLANESNAGANASGWANVFSMVDGNTEAVFVTLYNDIATGGVPDFSKNNSWEHGIRPSNAMGGGGKTPSAMMVDMFPMADGKRPSTCNTYTTLEQSSVAYDKNVPFANRDPRFYRTFAFPGVRWAFSGDPKNASNNNPYTGDKYNLWNYVWYANESDRDNEEASSSNTYGADNLLTNAKGFYIRKRSDDLDVNSNARYKFSQANGFKFSGSPYLEIRYAEVLLNYAEAACGAGEMGVAVEQLKKIRTRVGYTSANNFGLQTNLSGDQAACFAAILYERQIELAYEGKRFDDLRRWMLFDGGAERAEGAPDTWVPSGWNGNTCTYLGFEQLNGQGR